MSGINAETSLQEIAVLVSEALADANITAVLGGGGAVTQYSNSEYMSKNLDFITVARNKVFPPGPLSFGDRYIDTSETTILDTKYGKPSWWRYIRKSIGMMFVHGRKLRELIWLW